MIGDVDIDVPSNFDAKKIFPDWIQASMVTDQKLLKHPCGIYPQKIPEDQFSNLSAIPYEQAELIGYTKIDFLHLSIYDNVLNRGEIEKFMKEEPDWFLLKEKTHHHKLFQLANHSDLILELNPNCLHDVADLIALIRPGKIKYKDTYKANKELGRRILYSKTDDEFSFKKSHAFSYALVIQVQLHLMKENRI